MWAQPETTAGEAEESTAHSRFGSEVPRRPSARHVVADGVARLVARLRVPRARAARAAA